MECLFCGMDVENMPYHRNGEVYCGKECADADTGADESVDSEDSNNDLGFDNGIDDLDDNPL